MYSSNPTVPCKENTYSRQDVLKHNTIDDCWVIIQNNVFDLTPFIKQHPGGADIILSRAGEDATTYFLAKHGFKKSILKQLEQYKIGILQIEEQIKTNDLEEPFFAELIEQLNKEKLYSTPTFYKNKVFWMRFFNCIFFFALSFYILYYSTNIWLQLFCVFIQAIIATSLFGLIAHEATHRNYPKNKFFKSVLSITWPIFWPFITQYGLRYEHNSHHIKIGDADYDYEVAAFASFIRYSGKIKHTFLHKYQHVIAMFMYPFYANIITTIGGINSTFWSKHNRKIALRHNISLFLTVCYFIILPAFIGDTSIIKLIVLYVVFQCVLFSGIYVSSAINHFVPPVTIPIPEEHKNKYAFYVCHNTTNFCLDSKFWYWYTGGFNIQLEHHLVPFVATENLRKMSKIVQQLCKKYAYPYYNYPTFGALWSAHYTYLKLMSDKKINKDIENEMDNKKSYQAR